MVTAPEEARRWVDEVARLTGPDKVVWCDGSAAEAEALTAQMLADGTLETLNEKTHPGCYLHRSDPSDVARTEHLTFICTPRKEDAGPNNNWLSPEEGHARAEKLFRGCMTGRTLYAIPYCMGPIASPFSRLGIEITDSPYVVLNMRIMTRMGAPALERLAKNPGTPFVRGWHSLGDLDPERRLILHFPEELTIKSIGSGYGGNALLGKKCHALRIASHQARQEGWLAEHMLILGIEPPGEPKRYVAAAFPSACGKTNLAMLIPPEGYREKGWKITTVGDDIAWLHPAKDGTLRAINPEAGFFGVAPGTSAETNPNALAMLYRDAIFTNVALTEDRQPWWEGLPGKPALSWRGKKWEEGSGPAAHPNSRFTVSASQCASFGEEAEHPDGVPISAIIFGGRRSSLVPLVYHAKSWNHGVLVGATTASETTAAATGKVGILRRDPMAMKPFCGYNFADYWQHWIAMGRRLTQPPAIFHVNWFRKDPEKGFLWPGFGDNIRVLEWILRRAGGEEAGAVATPIGSVPSPGAIDTSGLAIDSKTMAELCDVQPDARWAEEWKKAGEYLEGFGARLPLELAEELATIRRALVS